MLDRWAGWFQIQLAVLLPRGHSEAFSTSAARFLDLLDEWGAGDSAKRLCGWESASDSGRWCTLRSEVILPMRQVRQYLEPFWVWEHCVGAGALLAGSVHRSAPQQAIFCPQPWPRLRNADVVTSRLLSLPSWRMGR